MLNLLKEFEIAKVSMQKWIKFSPMMKEIFESAASRNIKMNVLYKAVNGDVPDLKDLYELATT